MVASQSVPYIAPEEYLELEKTSLVKHEYVDGVTYAMAGATDTHVTITGNLFAALLSHLRGTNCRVYFSDMKAQIDAINGYYYPDIMVTCDARDKNDATFKRNPKLIVEVLFNSTANFDRGDKFLDYQTLDSLKEYVLVSTHRQRVECFRRNSNGLWLFQFYALPTSEFELQSVGFVGSFAELYENVTFENER